MNQAHLEDNSRLRNVVRFIPVGVWFVVVTYLSLISGSHIKSSWLNSIPYQDKFMHMAVYFIASVLMLYGFGRKEGRSFKKGGAYTLAFCIAWGILMEYLQDTVTSSRHFEVNDIIANIIGAFLGIAVFKLILKNRYYGS